MKNAEEIGEAALNDDTKNIIMHHLGSFQDNDLEAVITDYTNESVLITQDEIYTGQDQIKHFFAGLMIHFPKHQSDFNLDKMIICNKLVYIVWHASTPSLEVSLGTDTFIINNGKISQQTFAGLLKFI
ncbi:MAG: nuclear transport factor 2 family protein [Bacteroidota bacterium]